MTLSVIQGTFTKSTSTSVPVTQNITGLSFTPKCIWMWTNGNTDANYAEGYNMSYGFSDGSGNGCQAGACIDNNTTSLTANVLRDDACICILSNTTPTTVLARGKVTGFSSGQVSFQWDANTAVASVIHYMIIGGTDITNVKVLSTTTATDVTGNKGYTGVGFQGDFIQEIGDMPRTINTTTNAGSWSLGSATSSTARWCQSAVSENSVGTSDTYGGNINNLLTYQADDANGSRNGASDFVSFDTDGFTLNWTDSPTDITIPLVFLIIKGGLWDVGNFAKKISTGTQDITITSGRDPAVIQLFSMNNTSATTVNPIPANNYMSIGGSDGTNHGAIWSGDQDAAATMVNTRISKTDACIHMATPNATASSSTTTGLATVSDINTAGKVTLNWTTADANAYVICYWVLSTSVVGTNFDRPLTAETISVSESITRLYTANRPPAAETITIGESQARAFIGTRVVSAETNTIGESMTRLKAAIRAPTAETITIGESIARLLGANRTLSAETITVSESLTRLQGLVRALTAETTAISESLVRVYGVVRALSAETTTVGESLTRVYNAIRALSDTSTISESLTRLKAATRALSDTIAISESLAKIQTLVRSLSDTSAISESLSRILGITRSLSDTTTIGESLSRVLGAIRALATQTTTIGESLSRVFGAVRTLSDTTVISESLARLIAVIRSLSDTTVITGIVDSLYTPVGGGAVNYNRSLSDTTAISESLARSISNIRSLIETTIIGESLSRILGAIRLLIDTTTISESLARFAILTRSLSDTTTISESLTKIYGAVRNLSDTVIISELLSRLQGLTRTLIDTTIISETLSRLQGLTKTLTDTTVINESLIRTYGIVKSLSDTISISESVARSVVLVRNLIESVTILESLIRTIIGIIVDYVPSLETDFTNYIDEMIISYIFTKWNATGQLLKGNDMIDANSPVEFKIGIHSSRPYQVLALEQQTEIDKLSINKFGGGISRFFTTVEVTVMVQRLQRDIPIELSQMEKEIQRIVCHYTRNEIVGIDDLILVGMRREFTNRNNNDWGKSIWSTKIYFKAEYLKVNTEIMNINGY